MRNHWKRLETWLHESAQWPWAPFVIALASLVDVVTMVIPIDPLVVAATLGCPKRWWRFCLAPIVVRVVCLFTLFSFLEFGSLEQIAEFFRVGSPEEILRVKQYLEKFGGLTLGVVAFTPIPWQPVAIFGYVAGLSSIELVLFFVLGQLLRYGGLMVATFGGKHALLKLLNRT